MEWDRLAWDDQYAQRTWDYLWDASQAPRYEVIAAWIRKTGFRRIVDIGCGHGVLLRHLDSAFLREYRGYDFSAVALGEARARWSHLDHVAFIEADAQALDANDFDDAEAIVLNEVLYSMTDPLATLDKLLEIRTADRASPWLLVSITEIHERVATMIRKVLHPDVREWIRCEPCQRGNRWMIGLLRRNHSLRAS